MESTYRNLAERLARLSSDQSDPAKNVPRRRVLVAIAGPPGSGKTTVAANVARCLTLEPNPPKTAVVSIDGFHLTLATLRSLPNAEEALARRGAPWTFDADGAVDLVRRLKASFNKEDVTVPTFDHAVKDPVPEGLVVVSDVQVCIIEGNYLLSDEGAWSAIQALCDEGWLVGVDPSQARTRIAARHLAAGIEPTMELALKRTDYNDIPNGTYVMEHSKGRYDLLINSVDDSASA